MRRERGWAGDRERVVEGDKEKGRKKKQRVGTSDGGGWRRKTSNGEEGENRKKCRVRRVVKEQMEGKEGEGREE